MGTISAIVAVFNAIPSIIKLLGDLGPEFVTLIKSISAWIKHASGNDIQGYMKKVGEAFAELELAKTQEERIKAAQAIADVIKGLP